MNKSAKLVIAAPGSGKTARITDHINDLVSSGTDPHRIYAVTFTREASYEMKRRTSANVNISTVHSLAYAIVSRNDVPDDVSLLKSSRFHDRLLADASQAASSYCPEIDFLFIDEAQDLSRLQRDFLRALLPASKHVTLVGDPMQSIFGFNGASPEFMMDLVTDRSVTTEELLKSYRIPRAISRFINNVFDTSIDSVNDGGILRDLHMKEDNTLESVILKSVDLSDGTTGILFRSNGELLSFLRSPHIPPDLNFVVPLSSHPLVSIPAAVITSDDDLDLGAFKEVSSFLGQYSWTLRRVLSTLSRTLRTGLILDRSRVLSICDYTGEPDPMLPPISNTTRKALRNVYEFLDLYRDRYQPGENGVEDLILALQKDDYNLEGLWGAEQIPLEILAEAVRNRITSGSETYFRKSSDHPLTAMTIHNAKGQEFDHVIAPVWKNLDGREEERILYVALTRARKSLSVLFPSREHNRFRPNLTDRLLREFGII